MNEVYLSTGAFTGRINGRNYKLLSEYGKYFKCDGFEFMMFSDYYDKINLIAEDYERHEIKIKSMHADKKIGDHLSTDTSEDLKNALEMFDLNCNIALKLKASKMVIHCWGIPHSDKNYEMIYKRISYLIDIAKVYNIDILIENSFCVNHNPLMHLENLSTLYPDIGFVVDTRCAEFHAELNEILKSNIWEKNIRHIHINDYKGGYKDWASINPIPQPTKGQIDWLNFWKGIKTNNYKGSLTLEAPSMQEQGVDTTTLNNSLDFIREGLML